MKAKLLLFVLIIISSGVAVPSAGAATIARDATRVSEPREVLYVRIPVPADRSQDTAGETIDLEGWVALPNVPPGVRVPVILHSTPYLGACGGIIAFGESCYASPDDPSWWQEPAHYDAWYAWKLDPIKLVRAGYAVAFFSVRGTGNSGGCFDNQGLDEQLDQVAIIDWLAAQPWSNRRVGMGGVSYPSATALEAAIHRPEALKTIVVSGLVSDLYTLFATPQGAMTTPASVFDPGYAAGFTFVPSVGSGAGRLDPSQALQRACPDVVDHILGTPRTQLSDDRAADYYDERRLIERFPDVEAAVLLAQGFLDNLDHSSLHSFQESAAWASLTNAPKRQIEGQWGHTFPHADVAKLDPRWRSDEWSELLIAWFDHWLKGIGGPAERLGAVDFQDSAGTWHRSRSWPPHQAREEVLYLSGTELSADPDVEGREFRAAHDPRNTYPAARAAEFPVSMWTALCAGEDADTGSAYVSEPLERDATIAGNPFAYLRLTSDQPGGIVAVHLVELTGDFACEPSGQARGVEVLAKGAADLRFHKGNFEGVDFPVNDPTSLRIDLYNLAEHVPAGHRLAVVVSGGDGLFNEWAGQPYAPLIGVHGDRGPLASHVVIPMLEGTLGGSRPTLDYPPRPFLPTP